MNTAACFAGAALGAHFAATLSDGTWCDGRCRLMGVGGYMVLVMVAVLSVIRRTATHDDDRPANKGAEDGLSEEDGADESTDGAEESTDGAEESADGAEESADGAEESADGAEESAEDSTDDDTKTETPAAEEKDEDEDGDEPAAADKNER